MVPAEIGDVTIESAAPVEIGDTTTKSVTRPAEIGDVTTVTADATADAATEQTPDAAAGTPPRRPGLGLVGNPRSALVVW